MDRFLVKRPIPVSSSAASSVARKKARQGDVTAKQRVSQYPKGVYYEDDRKMFCRVCNTVVDHVRKSVADKHIKRKVSLLLSSLVLDY